MANTDPQSAPNDSTWNRLAPFFSPPPEFEHDSGDFPSPLVFADGRTVRTPDDWQARRAELLNMWHTRLGPWPPVVQTPRLETLDSTRRENFEQRKVRFAISPEHTTDGYLLLPDGNDVGPAVLTVYYEPETSIGGGRELRDFGYQLTRRGFVTLNIGLGASFYYPSRESAQLQPLSALACVAANAYHVLATHPRVDAHHVGITGHSYGGKWAMFASCLYPAFACAAWSDGGIVFDETRPNVNYWEPWYLGYDPDHGREKGIPSDTNPRTGAYKHLIQDGHDLHELHVLMAPRPFLVSGGSEDPPERWRALNHTRAVNRLLGYENRVAMTNRPTHAPTPESNEALYLFFEHFLKTQ